MLKTLSQNLGPLNVNSFKGSIQCLRGIPYPLLRSIGTDCILCLRVCVSVYQSTLCPSTLFNTHTLSPSVGCSITPPHNTSLPPTVAPKINLSSVKVLFVRHFYYVGNPSSSAIQHFFVCFGSVCQQYPPSFC